MTESLIEYRSRADRYVREKAAGVHVASIGYFTGEEILPLLDEIESLREKLKTARGMASGLFPMVDRATWQGAGGDDGQGHYEGEYWAEQMEQEIASWKAEDA